MKRQNHNAYDERLRLLKELIEDLPKTQDKSFAEHGRLIEYQQIQKPEYPNNRPTICPVCGMPILYTPSDDIIIHNDDQMTVKYFIHSCGAVINYVSEYKRL